MTLDPVLLTLMSSTVTITPTASRDAYGKGTAGTARTSKAKVTYENKVIRAVNNEDIVTTATVWLPPTAGPILTTDKITLPDGTQHPVVAVYSPLDIDGTVSHYRVAVG